jgi:hypothetical protein
MKYSIRYLVGVVLTISFSGCLKETIFEGAGNIEGEEFNDFLRIQGHEYDSLIIENCLFDGGGLNIGDVSDVVIKNCTFKNIKNNALKVGFIGSARNITIENCLFENIGFNAIDSHERAENCTIRNCTIAKVALSDVGGAMAQAHHGIYWKGKNVLIENNIIDGEGQRFGNCISIRSSGIVRKNKILNSPKAGLMYYSNHPGSDSLIIENNFFINNENSIICNTQGNLSYHNENVVIRFNSLMQSNATSININDRFESTTQFFIYGNIVVNGEEDYLKMPFSAEYLDHNLLSSTDVGFVDINNDLHINSNSMAKGFLSDLDIPFPVDDIDGDVRTNSTLSVGADE